MHKPLSPDATLIVAAFATVAATAYAVYLSYEAHSTIDGVAVPAHYLEREQTTR